MASRATHETLRPEGDFPDFLSVIPVENLESSDELDTDVNEDARFDLEQEGTDIVELDSAELRELELFAVEVEAEVADLFTPKDNLYEDVEPGDSIGYFMREAGQYRLLTASEEVKYARQYLTGGDDSEAAWDILFHANMLLVISVARRYVNMGLDLADLVQDGLEGLMIAINKYDPEKKRLNPKSNVHEPHRFSTYATHWIRQKVLRGLMNKKETVVRPVNVHEEFRKFKPKWDAYIEKNDYRPSVAEMVSWGWTKEMVFAFIGLLKETLSLEQPAGAENEATIGDFIFSREKTPEEHLFDTARNEAVAMALRALPERERIILMYRNGLVDGYMWKQADISKLPIFKGITRQRIQQIEMRAILRLKNIHKNWDLEDFYNANS